MRFGFRFGFRFGIRFGFRFIELIYLSMIKAVFEIQELNYKFLNPILIFLLFRQIRKYFFNVLIYCNKKSRIAIYLRNIF